MSETVFNVGWVKAAIAGEAAGWNVLYKKYYPGMYTVALRICNDRNVAADAVQDAFVTAYLKLSQLNDPANFGGWLKQIVTNTCYRALSRQRKVIQIDDLPQESEHFWEDEISRKMDQLSTQSKLYGVLWQLPEVLHSTVILRYFSNFHSYEQISVILNVPIGTVRSRLNQAKLKLGEYWRSQQDVTDIYLRESEQWNEFYYALFEGMHTDDGHMNQFLKHIHQGQLTLANGKSFAGAVLMENMVANDREVGSWLEPVNVFSSGAISIIESIHFNSDDHPDHCPASSVTVLYREKDKASKILLHTASEKKSI
ncbi:RNA polymerase sigma factor [Dyadobacter sp. CY326]|uniref:RNA polymerase sigma factor n=1 Tax=Dyadobacter sp. CY326 TaxID=2907300 RepID=UPI001F1E645F|nr:sigma-70 family RNA polymerase sigma factor [Dyadobacter sp. CY326]MCE7067136.1 sigma-70 family RNA polymerase sigma factor [Dyadobacter sp. CY326]